MSQRIYTVYNFTQTPMPLWLTVLLKLVPLQINVGEGVEIHYKVLFGTMFLLRLQRQAEKLCARCGSDLN